MMKLYKKEAFCMDQDKKWLHIKIKFKENILKLEIIKYSNIFL